MKEDQIMLPQLQVIFIFNVSVIGGYLWYLLLIILLLGSAHYIEICWIQEDCTVEIVWPVTWFMKHNTVCSKQKIQLIDYKNI